MKEKTKTILKIFFITFSIAYFTEIIFRILNGNNDIVLFRILLFASEISLVVTAIMALIPKKARNIFLIIYSFALSVYSIIQLTFHSLLGTFMSVRAGGEGGLGRVTDMIWTFIRAIHPVYLTLLIPFIFTLYVILKTKDPEKKEKPFLLGAVITVALAIGIHFINIYLLNVSLFSKKFQTETDENIYKYLEYTDIGVNRLGIMTFLVRDIYISIFPQTHASSNALTSLEVKQAEENYERVIDDTVWDELYEAETNVNIKKIDEYYRSRTITPKNEYTGLFEGKNFIHIFIEAFDMMAIDQDLTPTLYKLATEGWYFDNYYSPAFSNPTGESEFIAQTSMVPAPNISTPNVYSHNSYPYALMNLFKDAGYVTTSFHNYTDVYYDRETIQPAYGSDHYYNPLDPDFTIDNYWTNWPSDENLFEQAIPLFMDSEELFSTFIITVSMHFPYDVDSATTRKYWDLVKDLDTTTEIKRYKAKAIDLDRGLELLLEALEERGKLADTVIVLHSDHHPMHLSQEAIDEASPVDRIEDRNFDKTPMIIYNSEMDTKVISTPATTFDVFPTVANLFNLTYDPRLLAGNDLFSEESPHYAMFADGSWITEDGYYNATTSTFKSYKDETLSDEEIIEMNNFVSSIFSISKLNLEVNYFKYRDFDITYIEDEVEEIEEETEN